MNRVYTLYVACMIFGSKWMVERYFRAKYHVHLLLKVKKNSWAMLVTFLIDLSLLNNEESLKLYKDYIEIVQLDEGRNDFLFKYF